LYDNQGRFDCLFYLGWILGVDIQGKINQANGRLKAGKIPIRIGRSGDRLWLRATLPPKPNSTTPHRHQQRIYLGVPATADGLKRAEAEARAIASALTLDKFDWGDYGHAPRTATVSDAIAAFEQDYFSRRRRTAKSELTFRTDYQAVFRKLPHNRPLSSELLRQTALATDPDTKTRRRACMALGALAKFSGLDCDLSPLVGQYSPRRVQPRNLPPDALIAEWRDRIQSPEWQWAYGAIATFGLRPHEVFLIEAIDDGICTLTGGKTGPRKVWALYPEWCSDWSLAQKNPPQCSGRDNGDLGHRVSQFFRRLDCPFRAYDLRHCWARRAIEFGLDISLAAAQLGHSVKIHADLYQAWIGDDVHQRAYRICLGNPNRPLAP
jgi:integrase